MFYGITIYMYNTNEHYPPHFHVRYSGQEAVFSLKGKLLEGKIPRNKRDIIKAWTVIHYDELEANWQLAMNNEPLYNIKPLD